jgi:hypothetical protein
MREAFEPEAPTPATAFIVDDDDITTAIGKRINSETYGLRSEVLHETDRACRVRAPATPWPIESETWLPKSQVRHHGEDAAGRAIFVVPIWLARKKQWVAP